MLVNGAVLTEGTPDEIANDPQVRAVYLGHGEVMRLWLNCCRSRISVRATARPWCCKACRFSLAEGETLALLGRNGTGKTTLMDTLAGATRQHGGSIALAGVVLNRLASHERAAAGIGWVPQERNIFKSLTVHENLTAVARPAGATSRVPGRQSGSTRCSRAWPSARPTWAPSCPGGEQQMLAVGRALVLNPRLLLLDEPLEGLAPIIVEELLRAIAPHHARRRPVGHHRRAASAGHPGHQPPRGGARPRQRGAQRRGG